MCTALGWVQERARKQLCDGGCSRSLRSTLGWRLPHHLLRPLTSPPEKTAAATGGRTAARCPAPGTYAGPRARRRGTAEGKAWL